MKTTLPNLTKRVSLALLVFFIGIQTALAQDALTCAKFNIQNVVLSTDRKTISYDIYVQDIDATMGIAIPGFLFRMMVPQSELGTNAKIATVTNASTELGVSGVTMSTSGTNWLMKFTNANFVQTYGTALLASETFPGSRLGTFNISNADGTAFSNPQPFTATFSGTGALVKSTVSVFQPGTTLLGSNTSSPLPDTRFTGLQNYPLTPNFIKLTITDPTIPHSKPYDRTTDINVTIGTVSGKQGTDDVTVSASAHFDNATVGTGKTVTVTYSLGGADAGKYSVPDAFIIKDKEITALPLTISGVTAVSRPYDRGTVATLTGGTLNGIISPDVVTLQPGTGAFADKTAANGKTVTATGYTLGGADAVNYIVAAQPTGITADITTLSVSISGVTAVSRPYDRGTVATLTGGTLTGVLPLDVVTLQPGTGAFADKTAANGKTVTATGYTLGGADAVNYIVAAQPTGITADITKLSVSISGVTAVSRPYDRGTVATLTGGTLTGVLPLDVVTLQPGTGAFADKTAANGKTVTATGYTLGGADAVNYIVAAQPTGITADITTLSVSISGVTAVSRPYDRGTVATLTGGTLTGVLPLDVVTLQPGTGAFADKTAANGKTVTATGYTLGGADAVNYIVAAQPTGITADITTLSVSISGVTAVSRPYDRGTVATLTGGTLTGVLPLDVVTLQPGTGAFADKTAANGKTVTATGYTLGGADAVNYIVAAQPTGITADITTLSVSISGVTAVSRPYDRGTVATLTGGTLTGVLPLDVVTLQPGTGAFADKTAANGKTVTATGYTLGGADAVNYIVAAQPTGITADITTLSVSISGVTAVSRPYDRGTVATLTGGTLTGVLPLDVVTLQPGTGAFADKTAANGKTVTATGYTLGGADAVNYIVAAQPTGITADITTLSVSISGVTAVSRPYDRGTVATLTGGTLTGVLPLDVVTLQPGTGAFADKTAANGKTVTATGYTLGGADAVNYIVAAQPTGITADITTLSVSISEATASNKPYDGGTVATLTGGTLTGVLPLDVVTLQPGTGAFADKAVANGKAVTATGYTLGGADAANYIVAAQPIGLTANIVAAQLSIQTPADVVHKRTYDGTTTAVINTNATLAGVVSGETVTLNTTASYDNSSATTGKTITLSYTLNGLPQVLSNYIAPTNETITNCEIWKKPLTVSTPNVTSNKIYDGTTTAAVTAGTLSGVLETETSDVELNSTASYTDMNPGSGKTITVSYTLSGPAANNYLAPDNNQVNTGQIDKRFTVKAYFEGMWNSSSLNMNKCKEWDGAIEDVVDKYTGDIVDLVTIELHSTSTYSTINTTLNDLELHQNGTITSPGLSSISIPLSLTGDFVITIKSRNHLETSSANGVSFSDGAIDYDFTDAATKSYETDPLFTPTKLVDGKWMLYAGNVITDSEISEIVYSDVYQVFNNKTAVTDLIGYTPLDLTGDGFVDDADVYMLFKNLGFLFYKE